MKELIKIIKELDERNFAPGNEDRHYKKGEKNFKIEPIDLIDSQRLPGSEANVIRYICRHPRKGKEIDIFKAIWYCIRILKRDYSEIFNKKEEEIKDQLKEDIYYSIPLETD